MKSAACRLMRRYLKFCLFIVALSGTSLLSITSSAQSELSISKPTELRTANSITFLPIRFEGQTFDFFKSGKIGMGWAAYFAPDGQDPDQAKQTIIIDYFDQIVGGNTVSAEQIALGMIARAKAKGGVALAPFAAPDPRNKDQTAFFASIFYVYEKDGNGDIWISKVAQEGNAVIGILYKTQISGSDSATITKNIKDWLSQNVEKFGGDLGKLVPPVNPELNCENSSIRQIEKSSKDTAISTQEGKSLRVGGQDAVDPSHWRKGDEISICSEWQGHDTFDVTNSRLQQSLVTSREPSSEPSAQICVERPENSGVLNIRQADVVIEHGPTLHLFGGQSACVAVDAGKRAAWVQSISPYEAKPLNHPGWKSAPIEVDSQSGENINLRVCAKSERSTYNGWILRKDTVPCE